MEETRLLQCAPSLVSWCGAALGSPAHGSRCRGGSGPLAQSSLHQRAEKCRCVAPPVTLGKQLNPQTPVSPTLKWGYGLSHGVGVRMRDGICDELIPVPGTGEAPTVLVSVRMSS